MYHVCDTHRALCYFCTCTSPWARPCLSAAGVCVILYADDILLIVPSVCGLDALTKTCEIELDKLDMVINTRKSCCLRIRPRNNATCLPVSLSHGTVISWVDEMMYLGIFIVRLRTFKCSLEHAKKSFYRAANAVFAKVGRVASEEVTLQLIKVKCLPASTTYYMVLKPAL